MTTTKTNKELLAELIKELLYNSDVIALVRSKGVARVGPVEMNTSAKQIQVSFNTGEDVVIQFFHRVRRSK